jgi:hypothetical protein
MLSAAISNEALPDLRQAARYIPIIRTAKLIAPAGEMLCVVRDVSATGLRIRLFSPLPAGAEMLLEFRNGEQQGVTLVWQKDDTAGFRFSREIDVARLLEDGRIESRRSRPIRLKLEAEALLHARGETHFVTVRDISQQGAHVECGSMLAVSEPVRVGMGRLAPVGAKVRWRRNRHYGLVFEDTFRFDELAHLTARLQGLPLLSQAPSGSGF